MDTNVNIQVVWDMDVIQVSKISLPQLQLISMNR